MYYHPGPPVPVGEVAQGPPTGGRPYRYTKSINQGKPTMNQASQIAKLTRRLRHAKALAAWPNNLFVRAFGHMMVRRLTNAIEVLSQSTN